MQTSERIRKKLPALVVVMTTFAALIYLAGARTFGTGFLYSFGLWTIVKLYVAFVLDCDWRAHTLSVWIPETGDMRAEYQDYRFYMSSIPRNMLVGAAAAAVIGGIVQIL